MDYKKLLKIGGVALGVLLICLFWFRSCSVYDPASISFGWYKALKDSRGDVRNSIAKIELLNTAIKKFDEKISFLNGVIDSQKGDISALQINYHSLEVDYANAKNDTERLSVALLQIESYKQQFSLSQTIIKEYEGMIFALTEKYDAQLKISETWKVEFEKEYALRLAAEEVMKSLKKDLSWSKFGGTVKTTLIAVAVGYVGYDIIRGK